MKDQHVSDWEEIDWLTGKYTNKRHRLEQELRRLSKDSDPT